MMKDVSFDDAMEEGSADEAKLAVDRRSGTACEVPCLASVMWERRIGVLQVGDRNCG